MRCRVALGLPPRGQWNVRPGLTLRASQVVVPPVLCGDAWNFRTKHKLWIFEPVLEGRIDAWTAVAWRRFVCDCAAAATDSRGAGEDSIRRGVHTILEAQGYLAYLNTKRQRVQVGAPHDGAVTFIVQRKERRPDRLTYELAEVRRGAVPVADRTPGEIVEAVAAAVAADWDHQM
ncbi:MAG TPA: hypothetical protein VKD22_01835 [Ramlibacter sp.]|nr:hypothetical protein [Ramlibacter sp.]